MKRSTSSLLRSCPIRSKRQPCGSVRRGRFSARKSYVFQPRAGLPAAPGTGLRPRASTRHILEVSFFCPETEAPRCRSARAARGGARPWRDQSRGGAGNRQVSARLPCSTEEARAFWLAARLVQRSRSRVAFQSALERPRICSRLSMTQGAVSFSRLPSGAVKAAPIRRSASASAAGGTSGSACISATGAATGSAPPFCGLRLNSSGQDCGICAARMATQSRIALGWWAMLVPELASVRLRYAATSTGGMVTMPSHVSELRPAKRRAGGRAKLRLAGPPAAARSPPERRRAIP